MNESDVKGLTEMKPGSKKEEKKKTLIHAHSYSLVAAAHWHTLHSTGVFTHTHTHKQINTWTRKWMHTCTHAHTNSKVGNSLEICRGGNDVAPLLTRNNETLILQCIQLHVSLLEIHFNAWIMTP